LLEPRSFNAYKNAVVPIIAMLGCSEVNMKISSADMENVESNDYREMSGDNSDVNRILATM